MKRIFGILALTLTTLSIQAFSPYNDPLEAEIEIYPAKVSTELNIDVDEQLANGAVTVAVFNSVGDIVLEETLGLGLNKLDVSVLKKGSYVAVVRKNDEYRIKSQFEVI